MITNNKKPRFCMGNTLTKEELFSALCEAAGYMKAACGVGNNAAHMVMLEALDHIRLCKAYRQEVKRSFKQAIEEWHVYERRLWGEQHFQMFCVADMPEKMRRKYGDITDREYYDYWSATGCAAYEQTRPLLTCLQNKYRKSMERHDYDRDTAHLAWGMTAMTALVLAGALYDDTLNACVRDFRIPKEVMQMVFGQLSPHPIRSKWQRSMSLLIKDNYELFPDEQRDIDLGVQQLSEKWRDPQLQSDSILATVQDYPEVFRDKKTQQKVISQVKGN